jgi:hypothetical protein
VLVHPHDAGIDLRVPVQIGGGVSVGLQLPFDLRPGSVLFPPENRS